MIQMHKPKLVSFMLALLAAILLWVYAVTVVNPDDKTGIRGVPVRITGINELQMNQLMLTGGEIQYVDVEIAGRRSDLKELNNTTLSVVADVGKISGPGTYELSWVLDPPSTVASGDIKLVSSSTNKIKVKVSEYRNRPQIPIQIEYRGAVAEGFVRDPAATNLEYVSVSGPAEEIDKIACARLSVDLNDTKTSLDLEAECELIGEDGEVMALSSYVEIHDPVVRVMVPVYCFKQIKLELDIVPGGGADIGDVRYTLEPSVIGVVGDEDALKEMPSTLVIKTIKLAEIKEKLTMSVVPELPAGVSNRDENNIVRIDLVLEGLTTRTIYVPTVGIIRENDDAKLEFAPERIPVTVRGKTDVIHSLNAEKIRITADMENDFDSNTMTVKLTVMLEEGVEGGILGNYTISVKEPAEGSDSNETTGDR